MDQAPAAVGNFLSGLFGYRGRIGRKQYWIGLAVAIGAFVAGVGFVASAMNPTGGGAPFLALPLLLIFVWIFAAITIKRLRDAGWPLWARLLFAAAPALWIVSTLELIEYIGGVIGIVMAAIFIIPGILPSAPADEGLQGT